MASGNHELTKRVISGIIMIALALFGLWQGGVVFTIIIALMAALAIHEWVELFEQKYAIKQVGLIKLLAVLIVCSTIFVAYCTTPMIAAQFLLGAGILFFFLNWWLTSRQQSAWLTVGLAYVGYGCLALITLRLVPSGQLVTQCGLMGGCTSGFITAHGFSTIEIGVLWVLYLFLVVWGTDIGAYFTGRTIGGAKLCPRISPSKTWSGLAGGVVFAALLSWGCHILYPMHQPILPIILAMVLAVVAQGGDLFESYIKRHCGVKDSGNLIPGHGGVLDRIDGLLSAAMVLLLCQLIFQEPMIWW